MAEFSAFGIAGARVDRIAKNAGCNKNLIYIYFENKETLFSTFLQKHLSRVYEDIAFTPENLPGYAMRAFDYTMANPDLMRLMSWFSLEQKNRESCRAPRSAGQEACSTAGGAKFGGNRFGFLSRIHSGYHHDTSYRMDSCEPFWQYYLSGSRSKYGCFENCHWYSSQGHHAS